MFDFLLANEPRVRLACFLGVFAVMALWEMLASRRALSIDKRPRWTGNLGLALINGALPRLLLPASVMSAALLVDERRWGLFNILSLPVGLEIILAVAALDLIIYWQHVLFHMFPALWRLHRVHHADLEFDVTTGVRFHPVEITLSMMIKFAAIAALGPAPIAVLIFEVLLNAAAMFNHSNARLPLGIDRALRWVLVTPDMHRVHHSIEEHETNSNFGFALPLWDRLFGTYKDQPDAGHEEMAIGLRATRAPRQVMALAGMLLLPLSPPEILAGGTRRGS